MSLIGQAERGTMEFRCTRKHGSQRDICLVIGTSRGSQQFLLLQGNFVESTHDARFHEMTSRNYCF